MNDIALKVTPSVLETHKGMGQGISLEQTASSERKQRVNTVHGAREAPVLPCSRDQSLFSQLKHPFIWTTARERQEVLDNTNEPLWHRFLEEADRHFSNMGGLRPGKFPLFCHDGDLDEVMAAAVLAYVKDDAKSWHWVGNWLRDLLVYYRSVSSCWRENRQRIMCGDLKCLIGQTDNPRQFFEGFTRGGSYWVEAGLTSVVMHLVDLLEAYSPNELGVSEKIELLGAVSDYATRYAFHEEAFKYSNRGIWANSAVLLSAIAHPIPRAGELLRFQAAHRNDELRSTFLDDGFHAEGAPDYHLMAADGLLAYALVASGIEPTQDLFAAKSGEGVFQHYPSFVEVVRSYLRTVIPGPQLWNNPRGCSVSTPVTVRPALVYAWKASRDPEIGWFLRERMGAETSDYHTPLQVTKTALLGLGHYQPLLNFWLYRPVERICPPKQTLTVLPDHGALYSRSKWDAQASCVTVRFGFEGTGKGHRDHAHVTVTVGGVKVLKDPFPRFGPAGLDSSLFHNTVTLDNHEPAAVIGKLHAAEAVKGAEAFLIGNSGGVLPDRSFLYDPCEESNYWFTNGPETADFIFHRAILHVHNKGVVLVDQILADRIRKIDWFFHSDLVPAEYNPSADVRLSCYQLRQRNVAVSPQVLSVGLRGGITSSAPNEWHAVALKQGDFNARISLLSIDTSLKTETGHWAQEEKRSANGISLEGEVDYFLRVRAHAKVVHTVWAITWGEANPEVRIEGAGRACNVQVRGLGAALDWNIDFDRLEMKLESSAKT